MGKNKEGLEKEEIKRPEHIIQLYRERLMVLRYAQDFATKGDIPKAVQRYSEYLNSLAAYHSVSEEQLSPKLFNKETEVSEMLLISHAYWFLAKAYDRSPRLLKEFRRCLDQFVRFSKDFKYQHVNAQMLKKYMRKRQSRNPKDFNKAYEMLYVKAKGCFIASYAFNEDHPLTNDFRQLKTKLVKTRAGLKFIELYYQFSPSITFFLSNHPSMGRPLRFFFFRPLLKIIHLSCTYLSRD